MILVATIVASASLYFYIPFAIDFYKENIKEQPINKEQYIEEKVDVTQEELVYDFFIDEAGEIYSESETQYEYKVWNEELNVYKNIRKSEKLEWVKGNSIRVEANVVKYSISYDVGRIYNDDGKLTDSWLYYEIPILDKQSENDYIEYAEWKNERIDSAYNTYLNRLEGKVLNIKSLLYGFLTLLVGALMILTYASFILEIYDEVIEIKDKESKGDGD